jgi:hypothetical protein
MINVTSALLDAEAEAEDPQHALQDAERVDSREVADH